MLEDCGGIEDGKSWRNVHVMNFLSDGDRAIDYLYKGCIYGSLRKYKEI